MSAFLSGLEKRIVAAIPLSVYPSLVRRDVLGLVYHAVASERPAHMAHLYPIKTPAMFERDLRYLRQHYHPISYDQLYEHYLGGVRLKPGSVLLTFDDGYKECYTIVRPLLLKHGIPCVFFIITDLIDNHDVFYRNLVSLCIAEIQRFSAGRLRPILHDLAVRFDEPLADREALVSWVKGLKPGEQARLDAVCQVLEIDTTAFLEAKKPYLSAPEIRTLAEDGFTIGAHSTKHTKFNLLNEAQIEDEIVTSCHVVAEITQSPQVPFAFPFSGYGIARPFLADLRSRHDILGLYFDAQGLRPDQPFVVNRIWADRPSDPADPNSNLDQIFHAAYQDYALWRRRYLQSVLKEKIGI